jgi:hypothetical protein
MSGKSWYDGTAASIGLISASAVALFIGTGYIALDTGFDWTGRPASSRDRGNVYCRKPLDGFVSRGLESIYPVEILNIS